MYLYNCFDYNTKYDLLFTILEYEVVFHNKLMY